MPESLGKSISKVLYKLGPWCYRPWINTSCFNLCQLTSVIFCIFSWCHSFIYFIDITGLCRCVSLTCWEVRSANWPSRRILHATSTQMPSSSARNSWQPRPQTGPSVARMLQSTNRIEAFIEYGKNNKLLKRICKQILVHGDHSPGNQHSQGKMKWFCNHLG